MKLFDIIAGTKCTDVWKDNHNARCCHCLKKFDFIADEYDGDTYNGRYLCSPCYNRYYGYCTGCDTLQPYEKMILDEPDGFFCPGCHAKRGDKI